MHSAFGGKNQETTREISGEKNPAVIARKNLLGRGSTRGETPFATVKLTPSDIAPRDGAFLREWASNLGITIEVLLKRILIAAIVGQLYAEKIPEI